MAKKKITDLQLISAVTDDLNLPGDNGIQSYRATALQLKNYVLAPGNVGTTEIANEAVTLQKLANSLLATLIPIGAALPYTGDTAPSSSFILPQGQELNRTTYAEYFALVGTRFGEGDGATTFNAPDWRGIFLRGYINIPPAAGSGSASSNNATFLNHGIDTGMLVEISGSLTGLSTNIRYVAIKIDNNTLAFATSRSNAYAGTKITISGSNSATVRQVLDPEISNRDPMRKGGTNSGIGSIQEDSFQSHKIQEEIGGSAGGSFLAYSSVNRTGSSGTVMDGVAHGIVTDGINGTPRMGKETRPKNTYVNYILRVL